MIQFQAFRSSEQTAKSSRDDYVVEEKAPRNVLPLAFLLIVSTVLLYLKSFLPERVEASTDERLKEAVVPEETAFAETSAPSEAVDEQDVAPASGKTVGSSNVVPISFLRIGSGSLGSFLANDAPALDFSRLDRNSVVNLNSATESADSARRFDPKAGDGRSEGGGGSSGGGGGGGSDRPDDEALRNRPPRTSGPIRLQDLIGCQTLFISSAMLLAGTIDADGDALSVLRLTASSGKLVVTEGGWLYTAAGDTKGNVLLSYAITDGKHNISQIAHFSVIEAPPIIGTPHDDNLLGTTCGEVIDGLAGDDNIDARAGDDIVYGGEGNDHILAGSGNDAVYAGPGNDIVFAGAGHDIVFGGQGDDRLFGEAGNDVIHGEEGNDLISGGDGIDTLYGGDDDDQVSGDAGKDILDGGNGLDTLDGGAEADTLFGRAGNDIINGGDGNDLAFGGTGNDCLMGDAGNDTLFGEEGDDIIAGGEGADTLLGDAGNDTVSGDAGNDVIEGGEGNDRLKGDDGRDIITAGAGDDVVSGGDGNDILADGDGCDDVDGGAGDDHMQAAADGQSDRYRGGQGFDTLDYSTVRVSLVIDIENGSAEGAEIGRDLISSFENVIAGQGDDDIISGNGPARLTGGAGRDRFEFRLSDDDHQPDMVRQITDFSIGDRLIVASYEIRYREGEDADDAIQDMFDDLYLSNADNNRRVRFRFEEEDGDHRTFVDLMNEDDSDRTFSLELFGHHPDLNITFNVS